MQHECRITVLETKCFHPHADIDDLLPWSDGMKANFAML